MDTVPNDDHIHIVSQLGRIVQVNITAELFHDWNFQQNLLTSEFVYKIKSNKIKYQYDFENQALIVEFKNQQRMPQDLSYIMKRLIEVRDFIDPGTVVSS